jgi:hypothetical protein
MDILSPGGRADIKAEEAVFAAPAPPPEASPTSAAGLIERKLIQTVDFTIEVKDIAKAADDVKAIAARLGGFVADSRSFEDDSGRKSVSLVLRIPVDKLSGAQSSLKEIGRVREERITGDDVTESYFDMETRLANAKKLEKRLLELLENKSQKLKDVLDVEKELANVRLEIEQLEGRKRFLDNRIDLATINVELTEPQGFGRGIFDPFSGLIFKAISAFTASIALLIVVLSAGVPWIVVLIAFGWLSLVLLRLWIRKRREAKERKMRP